MPLAEVFVNAGHILRGPRSPELGVELLNRLNEIAGQICFVCTLNLILVSAWWYRET